MNALEFINGMTQSLAWPLLIITILFYYKDKLAEFALEMQGIKLNVKLLKEVDLPKVNKKSPDIVDETSHYKLYSNGLLIQTMKLRIAPRVQNINLIFPITFPNELLSIQVISEDIAWTKSATLSNCELKIEASSIEREIQLKISGI